MVVSWTNYMKYRAALRGFNLKTIESILRYSNERYHDTVTNRMVAVGKYGKKLVVIPI